MQTRLFPLKRCALLQKKHEALILEIPMTRLSPLGEATAAVSIASGMRKSHNDCCNVGNSICRRCVLFSLLAANCHCAFTQGETVLYWLNETLSCKIKNNQSCRVIHAKRIMKFLYFQPVETNQLRNCCVGCASLMMHMT